MSEYFCNVKQKVHIQAQAQILHIFFAFQTYLFALLHSKSMIQIENYLNTVGPRDKEIIGATKLILHKGLPYIQTFMH